MVAMFYICHCGAALCSTFLSAEQMGCYCHCMYSLVCVVWSQSPWWLHLVCVLTKFRSLGQQTDYNHRLWYSITVSRSLASTVASILRHCHTSVTRTADRPQPQAVIQYYCLMFISQHCCLHTGHTSAVNHAPRLCWARLLAGLRLHTATLSHTCSESCS